MLDGNLVQGEWERLVHNFPHMDSNIPANPAYGVYISQLVRYARICTSKVDFINRLRGLSLRLRQQGFETILVSGPMYVIQLC